MYGCCQVNYQGDMKYKAASEMVKALLMFFNQPIGPFAMMQMAMISKIH